MPDDTVRRALEIGGSRLRILGPRRHLAPNVARSIGLDAVTARYVIFIDNDVTCEPGWMEPLVSTAQLHDAWVVRPIILQRVGGKVTIHEAGGDCHLERRSDSTCLVEKHRFKGKTLDVIGELKTEQVELFEFHTVLFDRDRLLSLGGPDAAMLATAEHLDLAIRIHEVGGTIWIEPSSQVIYEIPSKLSVRDLPFFLGRWSSRWATSSRDAFAAKHKADPDLSPGTWSYPNTHRTYAWRFVARLCRAVVPRVSNSRMVSKIDRLLSGAFDRMIGRFVADAVLRFAPRWRGAGLRGED